MTTAREDTRTRRAIVVGTDRPAAATVFGDGFERLLTTTYAELAGDLEATASDVGFIGVAAGPGMEDAVDVALAFVRRTGDSAPQVAVEIPWELAAVDHLRDRLSAPGAPALSEVRRFRDRPCVVLGGAPAPVHDAAWVLDAVLTAGTTAPVPVSVIPWPESVAVSGRRTVPAGLAPRGEGHEAGQAIAAFAELTAALFPAEGMVRPGTGSISPRFQSFTSKAWAISPGLSCWIGVSTTSCSTPRTSGATREKALAMPL